MFPMSEFLIFDKSKDLLSVHQAKKTIFQMDIEEISSKPSRLTNFFIYLFIYYQNKASLLNKF
jgi:type IV secretory pathway VirB4 component